MLLRVGRHSGAESVTLDGIRSIKILRGGNQPAEYSNSGAKTVWLAADEERARTDMQPFGWILLEPSGQALARDLAAWCKLQCRREIPDITVLRERLREARNLMADRLNSPHCT